MRRISAPFIILFFLSIIAHFAFFGYPNQAVFDEVYHMHFASSYIAGSFYFDIHPPLGKLILAGMGFASGASPYVQFMNIGDAFLENFYLWYRFLPTLAGALLPIIAYGICRQFNMSKLVAFFVGCMIIFENSLLVQSRLALLDSLLLAFGFGGILLYLASKKYEQGKVRLLLRVSAIACLSFAFSIKWTGLAFLGLIIIFEAWDFFRAVGLKNIFNSSVLKKLGRQFLLFFILPFAIYALVFAVHFSLLDKPGPGDPFMTPEFQDKSFPAKFAELNSLMLSANYNLSSHQYSSAWYTWPFMARPIYYWNSRAGDDAKIYYIGNPAVYWLSSLASLMLLIYCFQKIVRRKSCASDRTAIFLIAGYLFNFLPFALIGRDMFLYHYQAALVFAILMLGYLLDKIQNQKIKRIAVSAILIISFLMFIFFLPLTYGIPLSPAEQELRFWFSSWQ